MLTNTKKSNKRNHDKLIFYPAFLLLLTGLIMVLSSSSYHALLYYDNPYYFFEKQVFFAGIGFISLLIFSKIDYRKLKNLVSILFILTIVLLLLVIVPGVGVTIKGASRWLDIFGFRFSPSDLAKVALVFIVAAELSVKKFNNQNLLRATIYLAIVSGLIAKQPDLGTALTIAATYLLMIFSSGAHKLYLLFLTLLSGTLATIYVFLGDYRLRRVTGFLNPWDNPVGDGFQIIQSLYAFAYGGLFGVGIGNSRQKLLHLPERHTDFILSIIGEEAGFFGILFIIALYTIFALRGFRTAYYCKDLFGKFLSVGITSMISVQAIINIGVATGSMPVTGIALPLVSYGGSSLFFTLSAIGVLLNISSQTENEKSQK